MKKLLVLLISVLIIFSVIPFTASATELNLPETTPLIVKEAILNGEVTSGTEVIVSMSKKELIFTTQ